MHQDIRQADAIKIPICPTVDYLAGLRDHFVVVELSRPVWEVSKVPVTRRISPNRSSVDFSSSTARYFRRPSTDVSRQLRIVSVPFNWYTLIGWGFVVHASHEEDSSFSTIEYGFS